ncbi:hypothetical protein, partial [Mesorhizobium sp.]|uniref:hypothetical protein n=1 Tax=Mesorhizobium sp. TaxID=1871066 RepID=UPI0025D9E70A
ESTATNAVTYTTPWGTILSVDDLTRQLALLRQRELSRVPGQLSEELCLPNGPTKVSFWTSRA